jgi:hypothetical protein
MQPNAAIVRASSWVPAAQNRDRSAHSIVDCLKLVRQFGLKRTEGVQILGMVWPILTGDIVAIKITAVAGLSPRASGMHDEGPGQDQGEIA